MSLIALSLERERLSVGGKKNSAARAEQDGKDKKKNGRSAKPPVECFYCKRKGFRSRLL
ncbi:hypothetical protein X777_03302 [Ooceraea biroi]|uniref:Uncharacterized protein n=1 Tax=Ooceraea biroi TaxID=2015173 RepID=A0A026VSK2_OOCBI|nr:hypothetical protein X777_03302 [Ooceraea biroi]